MIQPVVGGNYVFRAPKQAILPKDPALRGCKSIYAAIASEDEFAEENKTKKARKALTSRQLSLLIQHQIIEKVSPL